MLNSPVAASRTYRRRLASEQSNLTVTPFVGRDEDTARLAWGTTEASQRTSTWRYGLRAVYRSTLRDDITLSMGVDGLASDARLARKGPMLLPPREGDVSTFGQPPSDDVAYDDWKVFTVDAALFASADLTLGPLSLTPGLRLSAVGIDGSRLTPRVAATPSIGYSTLDWSLEPRLSLGWAISSRMSLSAAMGLAHQAPDAAEASVVFGTPRLAPARGLHGSGGVTLQPTQALSIDAVGFVRALGELPVRNSAPAPERAKVLVQRGEGRAFGGQLVVRERPWKGFSAWAAYTLSRSERRDGPEASWRLLDLDQTHVLTVSVGQQLAAWRFGVRARWATGVPRTPVIGAYFDARRDLYQPVFGAQNTSRLPNFFQLDLEASRVFALGEAAELQAFIEILNATNHRNVEEVVYDTTYSQAGYLTGLPVFATLGARVSF
jgi:hypothetical protein